MMMMTGVGTGSGRVLPGVRRRGMWLRRSLLLLWMLSGGGAFGRGKGRGGLEGVRCR